MNRRVVTRGLVALGVILLAAQLVPVDRSNPPVQGEVAAPSEVRAILRRACYDCHSNAVRWPWYGRVAPVSWLLERDVREGRKEVNFSVFNEYPRSGASGSGRRSRSRSRRARCRPGSTSRSIRRRASRIRTRPCSCDGRARARPPRVAREGAAAP